MNFEVCHLDVNDRKHHVKAGWVSPELANELLLLNKRNRPISRRTVLAMIDDLKNGIWDFNGDTIKIVGSGQDAVLADGQHRLTAIAEANCGSVPCIIVSNLAPDVMDTIDQGRPRAVKDILRLSYDKTPSNESTVVAIGSMLMMSDGHKSYPPRKEIALYINDNYDELVFWAGWAKAMSNASHLVPIKNGLNMKPALGPSLVGTLACHMVRRGADFEKVNEFFSRIATGTISDNDETNVIESIRRRQSRGAALSRGSIGSGGRDVSRQLTEFALYINGYNRWIAGQRVGIVKLPELPVKTFGNLPAISVGNSNFGIAESPWK